MSLHRRWLTYALVTIAHTGIVHGAVSVHIAKIQNSKNRICGVPSGLATGRFVGADAPPPLCQDGARDFLKFDEKICVEMG